MHVLRVLSYWLSFIFLNVFLVLALVVPPVTMHLTNRNSIKNWITNPDVLDGTLEIVPEILSDSIEESDVGVVQVANDVVGIDHKALVGAIREVLTDDYLVVKIDPVVDGVYDWLEGKTDSPEFEVVLTDKLTAVVDSVSRPLKSELAKLSTCPPAISYSEDFNPLNAFCIPPNTNVEEIVDNFSKQITGTDGLEISVSSDDIDFDEEVIKVAPKVYSAIDALPLVLAGISLLFAVALVLLAKSVARGLKTLSWILMANGIVTALSFWIMTKLNFTQQGTGGVDDIGILIFENVLKPLSDVVISDIARTGITFGLIAATLGVVIWLTIYTNHKLHHEKKANESPDGMNKKKIKDTTPSEHQESVYINKISKK